MNHEKRQTTQSPNVQISAQRFVASTYSIINFSQLNQLTKHFRHLSVALLLGCLFLFPFSTTAQELSSTASELPALQYYNGVPYITGGIGSDEARIFKEQRKSFPLSLNFGQQIGERTAFAADVQVVIRDENDATIFNANSDGPYCLIDLEPGQYTLHATYLGDTKSEKFEIKSGQPKAIDMVWPLEILAPTD